MEIENSGNEISQTNSASTLPVSQVPENKSSKKLWILFILIGLVIVLVVGYFSLFNEKDLENNSLEIQGDISAEQTELGELAKVYEEVFQAAKIGDLDSHYSYVYYGEKDLEIINLADEMVPGSKENFKQQLIEKYKGLNYTIKEEVADENAGYLIVSGVKNQRQKKDIYVYFIKVDGDWKLNAYGWNHPADAIVEDGECNDYCGENGFWVSGNKYNSETKECFCWHEPPNVEDLSALNVEECEQKEKGFEGTCYLQYAKNNLDENYCKKVSIMNRKDCYVELAKLKNDILICDNLWDDGTCLAQFEGE